MEMGEKIKHLRMNLGLTLEAVGNAVGVGKSTVRKWETGDIANMRRDKIAALANILETTPAYLMGWSEEKPATISDDGPSVLDFELIRLLTALTPEEAVKIRAFVQGLLAAREV